MRETIGEQIEEEPTGEEAPLEEEDYGQELDEDDPNFDFGKAKMDYFKKRAKEILLSEAQYEYEGNPVQLPRAYKNLKSILRNPVVVHASTSDQRPHYLKMTFSMCRNAVNGERFLEVSKLQQMSSISRHPD